MSAPDVAYQVSRQFTAVRRRYLSVRLATAVCLAIGFFAAMWLTLGIIDYRWEWSLRWRSTTMSIIVASALVFLIWRVVSLARQTRPRRFAGIIERSFEEFGQRIRTVLDTVDGRVRGPEAMLTALGNQTLGRWESVSPGRLVPVRALASAAVISVAIGAVVVGFLASGGDWRKSLLRAIGSDQPYTMLEVTPGDIRLLEGTPVDVSLDLIGRTDRDVLLRYREIRPEATGETDTGQNDVATLENMDGDKAGPEWIESELVADSNDEESDHVARRKSFRTNLGKATWPIEYQFVSSGQSTRIHRIDIQPLIETKRIEIAVQPPEYTGLQTRLFSKPDLTVLERSLVTVTIELNHPLENAQLAIGPKTSQLTPTELDVPADATRWTFQLPTDDTTRWRFSGSGADGTPMEPVSGRLGIRRDTAPSIAWREPSDEIKVHTLAEVPLGVQVSDDYGIIEAGIAFQMGGDEEYILADWTSSSDPDDSATSDVEKTRLLLAEMLPLESFELSERDYIAYYAYAVDNRPWGNHRSESDVRYIDIRPLRQFYQEIDPPAGNNDGPSRVLVRLDEIIRRERFMINRTRKLVRSGTTMAAQLGTIDRLVENQSELADLTRFLAEFFISRGNDDVEALSQAEATMLQAADSLAAGSLDLALAQENDALLSLAEARRTLEIILSKRMSPQQRQQLRRLAAQLRQKLRRDRPETERELADSLMQIAMEQRRVASAAQNAMQNRAQQSSQSSSQMTGQGGGGGKPNDTDEPQNDETEQGESQSEPSQTDEPQPDEPQPESSQSGEAEADDSQTGQSEADADDPSMADRPDQADQPDPTESLFEQQIDLLERLAGIREQLSERLADSELMTRRMDEAQAAMDDLASKSRDGEFESVARQGREVSDQIEEMGLQLEALSAAEPVTRVSSLRDLTAALSGMEHQLSDSNEPIRGFGGDPKDDAADRAEKTARLARRMAARSETLGEVISSQADIGDIEMSEVNDQLRNFVEESQFLEQLESTETASQQIAESGGKTDEKDASEAYQRAVEYAASAKQLERLYQQLVTPRLARLKRMEQQANRLANQVGGGGGGKQDPETERELRDLKTELREESLQELAEMLDGGGGEDAEDEETEQESGGADDASMFRTNPRDGLALRNLNSMAGRLHAIADELRKRIQEVILLEIAVDRDTPIPPEYRHAVDGYFKALAADGDLENASNQPEGSQ